VALTACEVPDPELLPDAQLQTELGLDERDRVFTVALTTGVGERAAPDSVTVAPGDFVQFVSQDWLVHEVIFEVDSLPAAARAFLERTGQSASPPLLQRGARFVLSAVDAPEGRYPYLLEGNRAAGRGVVVVASPPPLP
jgi:plastocyanin